MKRRNGQVKILVVGNSRHLLDIDRTLLRRKEIEILTTGVDPGALDLAQRETLDLIVVEVGAGQARGFDLVRDLKSLPVTEDIPVILVADESLKEGAVQTRADTILYTPYAERELMGAVRRYSRIQERRHSRYAINLRFTFDSGERVGQAFSRVISASGAFLKTDRPMPRGTRLDLAFRLPGEEQQIRCNGVVRNTLWLDEANEGTPGFGVEFEQVDADDLERLTEFVDSLEGRLSLR